MTTGRRVALVMVALATCTIARADDTSADDAGDHAGIDPSTDPTPTHIGTAVLWSAVITGIPGVWYWSTPEKQKDDWTLGWDWRSWKAKLDFSAARWDTNPFGVNAVRHPLVGVLQYEALRTNGLGMPISELGTALLGAMWEFVVEYRDAPSINDLIMNPAAGIAIGEPLYQLGQLWRGGEMTAADRLRTALFDPYDAVQDLWRPSRWHRPRIWRSLNVAAGITLHELENAATRSDVVVAADFEVVNDPHYLASGAASGATSPGAWSRLMARGAAGNPGTSPEITGTWFYSRSSIAGHYAQDADGHGMFLGVGAAFSYRREQLARGWDRMVFAHVVGPQLQLVSRAPGLALRLDVAAYPDFAMIKAFAFDSGSPLPPSPPMYSTVQAQGYYDGVGASLFTRARADVGPWHLDVEAEGHRIWQLDGADRGGVQLRADQPLAEPRGIADWRLFWRASLGYAPAAWGVAITGDGAYRRGTWASYDHAQADFALGVSLTRAL